MQTYWQSEGDRERLLRELGEANALLGDVFMQAPAFMCVLRGPEHVFAMVNARYARLIGGREVIGRRVRDALPEVVDQGFIELLDRVYRSGRPFSGHDVPLRLQPLPGEGTEEVFLDFVYLPLRDAAGEVSGILVHGVDLTERHRADEERRASEERYRTLFNSIDEGFCVVEMLFDENGQAVDYRFIETNPAFEAQTGLHGAQGKTIRSLVPEHDEHWFRTYGEVALTGKPVRFVSEAAAMGRWFDVYATRVGEAPSAKVAVLFTDISARRKAELETERATAELALANRRKGQFLAMLAHELRNPLAPLRNGLQLMKRAADDPKAMDLARGMMERQLGHLVHLVSDLLDIARVDSGRLELKRQRVALSSVVRAAVETSLPLIEERRHALGLHLPEQEIELDADPTRIAQVLGNLLNNAAKYTPEGGAIELAARREAGQAVITVSDNGQGIAPESLARVFDMFAQLQQAGTHTQGGLGIGLSLVRHLVELSGGSVEAASAGPGRGSSFTVRLPMAAAQVEADAPHAGAAASAPAGSPPLKVLVVDDNVDAGESLAGLLELDGHEVRVSHDGRQALALASRFVPDVVFLDIGMPGMNGFEVARALRGTAGLEHLTLVALTGWGAEDDRSRSLEAGFDHHLTKPTEPGAIADLLSRVPGTSRRG